MVEWNRDYGTSDQVTDRRAETREHPRSLAQRNKRMRQAIRKNLRQENRGKGSRQR